MKTFAVLTSQISQRSCQISISRNWSICREVNSVKYCDNP